MRNEAHISGLDHLRAVAITMVFFIHYRSFAHPWWLDDFGAFGWSGVDLFFVLSGYLIASPLLRRLRDGQPLGIPAFFVKRALRILPGFWLTLLLYFSWPAFHEREALRPLWRYLTFTQNYGLDYSRSGTFSHAWSLCVEEQFYLVLPLLLFTLRKHLRVAALLLPALVLLGLTTRWAVWTFDFEPLGESHKAFVTWYRELYYPTHQRLDSLVAGVSLATLMTFTPKAREFIMQRGNWLLGASLVSIGSAWWLCEDQEAWAASIFGFPLVACSYFLLVAAGISPSSLLARIPARLTALVAKLSYAVYLTHKGVIKLVQTALPEPGDTLTFFCCVLCSLCVAGLIHILIERPALRAARRITHFW